MAQTRSYVLLVNGAVHERISTDRDIATLFHPDMPWMPVPDGLTPQIGEVWNGAQFVAAPPSPRPPPRSADRFQFRQALRHVADPKHAGKTLFDRVEAWCLAQGGEVLDAWHHSSRFDRTGLLLTTAAPALRLSADLLDAVFLAAAKILA